MIGLLGIGGKRAKVTRDLKIICPIIWYLSCWRMTSGWKKIGTDGLQTPLVVAPSRMADAWRPRGIDDAPDEDGLQLQTAFSLVLSLGSLRVWRHNPRLDACGASCCAPGVHAEIWKP